MMVSEKNVRSCLLKILTETHILGSTTLNISKAKQNIQHLASSVFPDYRQL